MYNSNAIKPEPLVFVSEAEKLETQTKLRQQILEKSLGKELADAVIAQQIGLTDLSPNQEINKVELDKTQTLAKLNRGEYLIEEKSSR